MNVATLSTPNPWNAFQQYRAAVKSRYNDEDAALMRGYRELMRGRKVLDIIQVMRDAGVDAVGRPKLAICRADATQVQCQVFWWNGRAEFRFGDQRSNAQQSRIIRLPAGTFPNRQEMVTARARVPLVPPAYRPRGDLRHYHLLWEAEWMSAPRDPILLRHLGKNLYGILAQWDLTPLERAVVGARS